MTNRPFIVIQFNTYAIERRNDTPQKHETRQHLDGPELESGHRVHEDNRGTTSCLATSCSSHTLLES